MKNNYRSKKYIHHRKTKQSAKATRLGNQISVSIILCVFILIISFTNNSTSVSLRKKTASLISENSLKDFEYKDNIKDNVAELVRCMFPDQKPLTQKTENTQNLQSSVSQEVQEIPSESNVTEINTQAESDETKEVICITEDWINPVENGVISSICGSRMNPVLNKEEYHNGIDIASDEGSNVYAVKSGTVTEVRYSDTFGNVLSFEADGYTITYCHLKEIFVNEGDHINQGETVGLVGSTGLTTGPHLHYTVYKGDMLMDPIQFTTY